MFDLIIILSVWSLLLLVGLILQIIEYHVPSRTPVRLQEFRFITGLFLSAVILACVMLSHRITAGGVLIILFGLAPLVIITEMSISNDQRAPILTSVGLFAVGIAVAFISVTSMSGLALLNNYPQPLLKISALWFLSIPVVLWLPRKHLEQGAQVSVWQRGYRYWAAGFIFILLLWLAMSQLIFFQSYRLAQPNQNCIMETDGQQHRWLLLLSPAKMFVDNGYKGKLAYLRAYDESGNFNHHWSFWSLNFVADETNSFDNGISSFHVPPEKSPCQS